ncbi:6-pyruvoyl-tetrahydropterin synthase [Hydrogenophaga palleronii]|uniref:6-carboxy-5,6,7,8-tetrahydropterin synthase n=1 Tax=Hydrogenophaga palleronii TaxID=65655 RepID=A0ABU1WI76_9BURK|nr:6-carboxytetrahydropterin synthase [Hydrogenophaga palleronii]MDR7148965.1 6-pyruvoyl-tetrahydropterin synthase [Hydrogenophaga palleronii]
MYAVNVRDHFMIAHSFQGEVFGPAQRMHGATYVVDLELRRVALDSDGIVVDIGLATQVLREVLAELNFRNLDEQPEFAGKNTTTEFLARVIFNRIAARIAAGALGAQALPGAHGAGLKQMRVTLNESHVAWASFEADLPAQP